MVITRTDYLRNAPANALIMNHDSFTPLFIDSRAGIDINTEQDFAFAEFMAQRDAAQTGNAND